MMAESSARRIGRSSLALGVRMGRHAPANKRMDLTKSVPATRTTPFAGHPRRSPDNSKNDGGDRTEKMSGHDGSGAEGIAEAAHPARAIARMRRR